MKEDYLWNKTGNDPEIESLENTLQVFRYKETAPPALPAKIIPFKEETPRKMFQFAFAFASCLAFVIISLGIWLQFSSRKVVNDSAEIITPQKNGGFPKAIFDEKPDDIAFAKSGDSTFVKIENQKQAAKPKNTKGGKVIPAIVRQNKIAAQKFKSNKQIVSLTKEEKYAFSQLMLALSITSSKLKLVKDKVEGIENQNAVLENGR